MQQQKWPLSPAAGDKGHGEAANKSHIGKERMADTDLAAWAAMHLAAGSQHQQSTCGPLACRSV